MLINWNEYAKGICLGFSLNYLNYPNRDDFFYWELGEIAKKAGRSSPYSHVPTVQKLFPFLYLVGFHRDIVKREVIAREAGYIPLCKGHYIPWNTAIYGNVVKATDYRFVTLFLGWVKTPGYADSSEIIARSWGDTSNPDQLVGRMARPNKYYNDLFRGAWGLFSDILARISGQRKARKIVAARLEDWGRPERCVTLVTLDDGHAMNLSLLRPA